MDAAAAAAKPKRVRNDLEKRAATKRAKEQTARQQVMENAGVPYAERARLSKVAQAARSKPSVSTPYRNRQRGDRGRSHLRQKGACPR